MPVKEYGIYLAYPPTVDLRNEGLGRYLAALIKGAVRCDNVKFVLVCPSWSVEGIEQLFESEGVTATAVEIRAPKSKPLALVVYERLLWKKPTKRRLLLWGRGRRFMRSLLQSAISDMLSKFVGTHDVASGMRLATSVLTSLVLSLFLLPLFFIWRLVEGWRVMLGRRFRSCSLCQRLKNKISSILAAPKNDSFVFDLFQKMQFAEIERMHRLIESMTNISGWYCPTAFWPSFNAVPGHRLMCVPDVVLTEFPVGFSGVGGDRFLNTFENVQQAIKGADHVVTYSRAVKDGTVVARYGLDPSQVSVVLHAPSRLDQWLPNGSPTLDGVDLDIECRKKFKAVLGRSGQPYLEAFGNTSVKFIFYASQLRPNKNVLSLLRAYAELLRRRFVCHKLILTGNPLEIKAIRDFVEANNLQRDVLWLQGLKVAELASFYKLADLAVNPSLSEGGCPFTFTEALSVGTPVVMANIPVTTEVLTDPELQQATLFDPYDWRDMADRIEWALNNRDQLLTVQRRTYEQLINRTWTDVAREHLDILDRISQQPVIGHA